MSFSGYDGRLRRGGGALILNHAEEVLLLLRGVASRNDRGLWSQPGGAVGDDDATPEAAVEREILEELGVRIRIRRFLTTTCHGEDDRRWLAYSYLAHVVEGQAMRCEPDKHASMQWFPLDRLPENLNEVTRDAVRAYRVPRSQGAGNGLLVFDMDGTLLPETTANLELARVLGAEQLVLELEAGYRSGVIDNRTYASRILDLYSRLEVDHIEHAFQRSAKLLGLGELVSWANAHGIEVAVLTTSPAFFARKFAEHFRFNHVIGGLFPVHCGAIDLSACDVLRDGDKPERAETLCARLGISRSRCVVVGDSRSDVALFAKFRGSIALNHDDSLNGKARYYVRTRFAPDLIPAIAHLLS